jgi:hypothetical protein
LVQKTRAYAKFGKFSGVFQNFGGLKTYLQLILKKEGPKCKISRAQGPQVNLQHSHVLIYKTAMNNGFSWIYFPTGKWWTGSTARGPGGALESTVDRAVAPELTDSGRDVRGR